MARKQYLPLFDEETFENILNRRLSQIGDEFDKREGSVNHDAHAPAALEGALLFAYLDFIMKNAYGNTADRYWLEQRALERGIEPYPASPSVIIGFFDVEIAIDEKFLVDEIYFTITKFIEEKDGLYYYELMCDQAGIIGNIHSGRLTPTRTIRDLRLAEIQKLAVLGEDVEDTEIFRDRYFETIRHNAYGGNIDDYRMKVRAIEGVGQCKVIPVWNGGGTVKIILTDPENNVPTEELIEKVQEILDPIPYAQKGVGVAPIGHLVTVVGVEKKTIDVSVELELDVGVDLDSVIPKAREKIENFFAELRKDWSNKELVNLRLYENIDVRLSNFLCLFLNLDGVLDYQNLKLNDEANRVVELLENEMPFLGNLTITEVVK